MKNIFLATFLLSGVVGVESTHAQECNTYESYSSDKMGGKNTTTVCNPSTPNPSNPSRPTTPLPSDVAEKKRAAEEQGRKELSCGNLRYTISKQYRDCIIDWSTEVNIIGSRCELLDDSSRSFLFGGEKVLMFGIEYTFEDMAYTKCRDKLGDVSKTQEKLCEANRETSISNHAGNCAGTSAWTGFQ